MRERKSKLGRLRPPRAPGLSWFVIVIVSIPVVAVVAQTTQEVISNFAAQIAQKRSQVETLSNELELAKSDINEQLRSLATQRSDVETQVNREELRLAQLNQDIAQLQARIRANQASIAGVAPLASEILGQLKVQMQAGLPFKVPERIGEVEELQRQLETGGLDPQTVLTRLWNLIESEFRLTTESGIYQQTIEARGQQQLAEVARLGMVLMYYKTFDDRYGYVIRSGEGWTYREARDRTEQQQIVELFDSLRRNLRQGFFELPNPLTER